MTCSKSEPNICHTVGPCEIHYTKPVNGEPLSSDHNLQAHQNGVSHEECEACMASGEAYKPAVEGFCAGCNSHVDMALTHLNKERQESWHHRFDSTIEGLIACGPIASNQANDTIYSAEIRRAVSAGFPDRYPQLLDYLDRLERQLRLEKEAPKLHTRVTELTEENRRLVIVNNSLQQRLREITDAFNALQDEKS